MFEFKPTTFKLPFNLGEIELCKKNKFETPFGLLQGEDEIETA